MENKNKIRHELLHDAVMYNKSKGFVIEFPIDKQELISLYKDTTFQRSKAVNFLLSYDYFKFRKNAGSETELVVITQIGLNALNSEYFLHEAVKERRERNNNRYTIAFGVITAIGVLFSIFNDSIKNLLYKEPEMKLKIELQPINVPPSKNTQKITFSLTDSVPKMDTVVQHK